MRDSFKSKFIKTKEITNNKSIKSTKSKELLHKNLIMSLKILSDRSKLLDKRYLLNYEKRKRINRNKV